VLATGGRALPKSGSDGFGYTLAQRLGHSLVPQTPALAPLVLDASTSPHAALSGVALEVELAIWIDGRVAERIAGSMLWTHFGVSGPAALNASRVFPPLWPTCSSPQAAWIVRCRRISSGATHAVR
jgi:predicted flavoprotein YhiN